MLGKLLFEHRALAVGQRCDERLARLQRASCAARPWTSVGKGSDGTTMAVCRKSSDATNVRWAPYASDQGPGRDSSLRIDNASGIFVRLVPGSTRRVRSRRSAPRPQGPSASDSSRSAIASARSASSGSTVGGGGGNVTRPSSTIWSASSSDANSNWRASDRVPRPDKRLAALGVDQRGGLAQRVLFAVAAGDLVGAAGDEEVDLGHQAFSARRMIWSSSATASRTLARSCSSWPLGAARVRRARARSARARARPGPELT